MHESSAIRFPNGPSYLVERRLFDESLRSSATAAGAEMNAISELPTITRARARWNIEIRNQHRSYSVSTPLLIDVSGRRASVVRRFGRRVKLDRLLCIYYLASGLPESDQDDRWLLAADANGWWFSIRVGRGERTFCRFTEGAGNIGADWWAAMSEGCPELAAIARAHNYVPQRRMVFDAGTSYSNFSVPGLAAAGDAAFSIDPLSGQGLASALGQGLVVGSYACEYLAGRAQALIECRMIQRQELRRMLTHMMATYAREPRWRDSRFWAQRTAVRHWP
jgi:flavin-dependent dehydrogenase